MTIFIFKWRLSSKIKLKLWLFEVAKSYGGHFEKTALKDFVILHNFLSNQGLEFAKLWEWFHGNKLDNSVSHAEVV